MIPYRAYAQLVRLPNVFTAFADICLGILATRVLTDSLPGHWWVSCAFLLAASACLYSGGMVWNDYFDFDQDRRERPFRPLPSGRISRRAAAFSGSALLGGGVCFAVLAGCREGGFHWVPCVLASGLVVCILLYDRWLKRTWAGPLGMGACRFLNVLLGLSAGNQMAWGWAILLAAVVGLYIVGVTWFARTEARTSSQPALVGAALVMLASLALALPLPVVFSDALLRQSHSPLFPYLLVGFGFLVGIPVGHAIVYPSPSNVQAAVKRAILGLVVLDAVLATALVGAVGLFLLLLLLPALPLSRWIYST